MSNCGSVTTCVRTGVLQRVLKTLTIGRVQIPCLSGMCCRRLTTIFDNYVVEQHMRVVYSDYQKRRWTRLPYAEPSERQERVGNYAARGAA